MLLIRGYILQVFVRYARGHNGLNAKLHKGGRVLIVKSHWILSAKLGWPKVHRGQAQRLWFWKDKDGAKSMKNK